MTGPLIIRPEAEADIQDAFRWYESQAIGLGHDFLRCVEVSLLSIEGTPELCAKIHGEIRRALVRRFPYAIFYIIGQERIAVVAVMHVKRHPRRWQNREGLG